MENRQLRARAQLELPYVQRMASVPRGVESDNESGVITIEKHIGQQFDLLRSVPGVSHNVINIVGIPGMGKTRLLDTVKTSLEEKGAPVIHLDLADSTFDTADLFSTAQNLINAVTSQLVSQIDGLGEMVERSPLPTLNQKRIESAGMSEVEEELASIFRTLTERLSQEHRENRFSALAFLFDNVKQRDHAASHFIINLLIKEFNKGANALFILAGDGETRYGHFEVRRKACLITLPPLRREELIDALAAQDRSNGFATRIHQMTAGIPGAINTVLETAAEVEQQQGVFITEENFARFEPEMRETLHRYIWEMINGKIGNSRDLQIVFSTLPVYFGFEADSTRALFNPIFKEIGIGEKRGAYFLHLIGQIIETDLCNWDFNLRIWRINPPLHRVLMYLLEASDPDAYDRLLVKAAQIYGRLINNVPENSPSYIIMALWIKEQQLKRQHHSSETIEKGLRTDFENYLAKCPKNERDNALQTIRNLLIELREDPMFFDTLLHNI